MNKMQIDKLLKSCKDDLLIRKCIALLENSLPHETKISELAVAKTKELIPIYRRRLTVHRNLSLSTIEGGETLFDALGKEAEEYIAVFEIGFPSEAFIIFTDKDVKRVVGCLSIQ